MSRKVFVVRRISFSDYGDDTPCVHQDGYETRAAGVPVGLFADRGRADEVCRNLEAEARRAVPPGRVVGYTLNRDHVAVTAGVRDLGLPPPALGDGYYYSDELLRWWESVAADATPEQRAGVWEALGVRFYDVVEVPLED